MIFTTAIYVFFRDDLTFPATFRGKSNTASFLKFRKNGIRFVQKTNMDMI